MSSTSHMPPASSPDHPHGHPLDADAPDAPPVSVSARLGRLQFHNSGKFRVLQLADIQDGPKVASDTVRLIAAALDAARPDVVVLSGNQIAGYDEAYAPTFRKRRWNGGWNRMSRRQEERYAASLRHTHDLVRQGIEQFLKPMIDRGIPWAVTYGNHDFQCGLDNAELDAIYREFPGCLNPESTATGYGRPRTSPVSGLPDERILPCEPGTFALPVCDVDRTHTVLGLVMVDSGDYDLLGGYGAPSPRALAFLADAPKMLGARCMAFQHIPVPQYYRLLKEVSATTAHAVEGYRAFSGRHFVIDETTTLPGSYLGEGVSCPDQDSGEFDVLHAARYFALAAGHDHRNRFVGKVDGVALAATPTCGFGSYGPAPAQRAVRLIEFDTRHPHDPRTQLLEFGALCGKPGSHKAYTYALNSTAPSPGETIDLLDRPGLIRRMLQRLGGDRHIRRRR
ncbi:serine/threonine protein phosphatase [Bifidobacterium mongoliense]|uniref:serine/threonine protein phosphatase n=1 Tax=Bifidobacterium mongoliense TaxID=518643 RepID=UPI003F515491